MQHAFLRACVCCGRSPISVALERQQKAKETEIREGKNINLGKEYSGETFLVL